MPSSAWRKQTTHQTATTEIYTLSLHDALPIYRLEPMLPKLLAGPGELGQMFLLEQLDRKSTRLNSSHLGISYAVFCLEKTNNPPNRDHRDLHSFPTRRSSDLSTRTDVAKTSCWARRTRADVPA